MEPGREDREYLPVIPLMQQLLLASMEPGREDREYLGRQFSRCKG